MRMPLNEIVRELGFKFEKYLIGSTFKINVDFPEDYGAKELVIISSNNTSNCELKNHLGVYTNKVYALEGEKVVIHFPNTLWDEIVTPKLMIDNMDLVYRYQMNLLGNVQDPYSGKLWFVTNKRTNLFKYMDSDHCGMSYEGALHLVNELRKPIKTKNHYPGWGFGHELGHAMVINSCGKLFEPNGTGESWCNIFNIWAYKESGLYNIAMKQAVTYPNTYCGRYGRYSNFEDIDFDLLPDSDRIYDVLITNDWVFLKLPMLLVLYYGWEQMSDFFTKAAIDHSVGVTANTNVERIEYMIVNLSHAYGLDLTWLFEYWSFPVSDQIRSQLTTLPRETILTNIYTTTKEFEKYEQDWDTATYVNVNSKPFGGGNLVGSGFYNYGEVVTVSATANADYEFINWTEIGNEVSSTAQYTFTIESDRDLTANFK